MMCHRHLFNLLNSVCFMSVSLKQCQTDYTNRDLLIKTFSVCAKCFTLIVKLLGK